MFLIGIATCTYNITRKKLEKQFSLNAPPRFLNSISLSPSLCLLNKARIKRVFPQCCTVMTIFYIALPHLIMIIFEAPLL